MEKTISKASMIVSRTRPFLYSFDQQQSLTKLTCGGGIASVSSSRANSSRKAEIELSGGSWFVLLGANDMEGGASLEEWCLFLRPFAPLAVAPLGVKPPAVGLFALNKTAVNEKAKGEAAMMFRFCDNRQVEKWQSCLKKLRVRSLILGRSKMLFAPHYTLRLYDTVVPHISQ